MGRPAASEANKNFAVAVAHLVTQRTDDPSDTIARCGKCSIFALLKIFSPAIVRDQDTGPRDGISEVELNKALQVSKSTKNCTCFVLLEEHSFMDQKEGVCFK